MLFVFEENSSAYQSLLLLQKTTTVPVGSHNGGETTGTHVFDYSTKIFQALMISEAVFDAAGVLEVTVLYCMKLYDFLLRVE